MAEVRSAESFSVCVSCEERFYNAGRRGEELFPRCPLCRADKGEGVENRQQGEKLDQQAQKDRRDISRQRNKSGQKVNQGQLPGQPGQQPVQQPGQHAKLYMDEVEGNSLAHAKREELQEIHRRFSRTENLAVTSRLKSASFRHRSGRKKVKKEKRPSKIAIQITEASDEDSDPKSNFVKVKVPVKSATPGSSSNMVKTAEVPVHTTVCGMVFDSSSQTLVVRTLDVNNPFKVYDHNVALVREFGKGISALTKGNTQRRLSLDTRRGLLLAPTDNSVLCIEQSGALSTADTFKIGTDLCGVSYSCEEDMYVVSDVKEHRIYVINAAKKVVLCEFSVRGTDVMEMHVPVHHVHLSSTLHAPDPVIVFSDAYTHAVRVYTVFGQQLQAFGSRGAGEGQLHEPRGVSSDSRGRVLVCDWYNRRVVGYTGGEEGVGWQCLVLPEGYSRGREGSRGRVGYPGLLAVDNTHGLVAVRANMNGHRIYMYRI